MIIFALIICIIYNPDDAIPPSTSERRPSFNDVSATGHSAWIDAHLPKLVAVMSSSVQVRNKVAGSLSISNELPFPLRNSATGLMNGDLEAWLSIVNKAVIADPLYGRGIKVNPSPKVVVMPNTRIVRVETIYPAPSASKDLEPQPLTITAWSCPDRSSALALLWFRKGGGFFLVPWTKKEITQSVLNSWEITVNVDLGQDHPGEAAFWNQPKAASAAVSIKGLKNLPPDRLLFLRNNLLIEMSTEEFVWNENNKRWESFILKKCASNIISIAKAVDDGLIKILPK